MSFPSQKSTVVAQPLIAVRNVRASSRWYAKLLGADSLPEHSHRDLYERISCSGQLLLQLHAWDEEDHPNLVNADAAPPGHGVLLWFAPQAKPRERLMGDTKCASDVSMLLKSGSHSPSVNPSAVIAPNATLVGDVRIGARCVIGYGACLIAEGQPITLGEQVIVRDNAVIRSTAKYPVEVGNAVRIDPHNQLFGCTIEDEVFLATGTRVFDLAVVRKRAEVRVNAVVHLKTVVPQEATVPIGWIAVGDPARILSPDQHDGDLGYPEASGLSGNCV